jgi:signal transduction histidine kinase
METPGTQLLYSRSLPDAGQESLGRQILALDSLSKLTRQFSDKPDFAHLIEILLMTLCGQFSVSDSFAILKSPGSHSLNHLFFATGKFRNDIMLASLQVSQDDWCRFQTRGNVFRVDRMAAANEPAEAAEILAGSGVILLCPLVHNDSLLGLVGLGGRVTGSPYGDEDTDILGTIMSTITPLITNSYLFWQITNLNAWYLDILNSVKQGVFVFDRHPRLKKVNAAGIEMLVALGLHGREAEPPVGMPIEAVFPECVFGEWGRQIIESLSAERTMVATNVVARSGAEERIYNVRIAGALENAGIGTALIVTLDDVTVQKEAEERLFDMQKLADKGLMASSIAHELNNHIGLILGGVELIDIAVKRNDHEKLQGTLERVKAGIANLERFTAGLTDYTRLECSKSRSNINVIIGDLLMLVPVQKRFKRLKLTSELDSSIPDTEIDPDQIAQLLLNLLNNAADAIGESDRQYGEILIETQREDDSVVLRVSDNGAGMAPDTIARLFTSSFTTKPCGHGYGLVVCNQIVEKHRGTIQADSTVGEGTAFTVRLPIIP